MNYGVRLCESLLSDALDPVLVVLEGHHVSDGVTGIGAEQFRRLACAELEYALKTELTERTAEDVQKLVIRGTASGQERLRNPFVLQADASQQVHRFDVLQ